MSIADKLREVGVGPGAIIEIGYRADAIDAMIADYMDMEKPLPVMQGYVLEVTAVGEESILAIVLTGIGNGGYYGDAAWERSSKERMFGECSMLQKVGQRINGNIEWTEPDRVNVYTRLQGDS